MANRCFDIPIMVDDDCPKDMMLFTYGQPVVQNYSSLRHSVAIRGIGDGSYPQRTGDEVSGKSYKIDNHSHSHALDSMRYALASAFPDVLIGDMAKVVRAFDEIPGVKSRSGDPEASKGDEMVHCYLPDQDKQCFKRYRGGSLMEEVLLDKMGNIEKTWNNGVRLGKAISGGDKLKHKPEKNYIVTKEYVDDQGRVFTQVVDNQSFDDDWKIDRDPMWYLRDRTDEWLKDVRI